MPEKIIRVYIDPNIGLQPFHCRKIAFDLKLTSSVRKQFVLILQNPYRLFTDYDCSLVEINPLVVTAKQSITALDAKTDLNIPVVIRMDGTNIEEGRRILYGSGFKPIYVADLKAAAQKISELAGAQKGLKK